MEISISSKVDRKQFIEDLAERNYHQMVQFPCLIAEDCLRSLLLPVTLHSAVTNVTVGYTYIVTTFTNKHIED